MTIPVALYKEIYPSTGVNHCASAYFTHVEPRGQADGDSSPNLIVVRSNILQIYQIRNDEDKPESCWLALVSESRLWGTVESLAVLKNRAAGQQRDAVMLAFRDAKVSVLDWDATTQSIVTTSLHSFEGAKGMRAGRTVFPHPPQLAADPQGRCAAAILQGCMAVFPAMEMDALDEMIGGQPHRTSVATTVGNSHMQKLSKLGIGEVRDVVFLHRYSEPVLLVLHEAKPSWAGILRERKDTLEATAFSLNVLQKRHTRLWSVPDLPTDALKLVAVPAGGALVLCQSLILHVSQGGTCSLAVASKAYAGTVPSRINFSSSMDAPSTVAAQHAQRFADNVHPDAASAAAMGAPRAEGFELDLIGCASAWLADTALLIGLATGQLVLLNLEFEGSRARRMKVSKANAAPQPSCMCMLSTELLFLGSWMGDSLLIRAVPEGQVLLLSGATVDAGKEENVHVNKRQRLDPTPSGLGDDDDDEVSLIYRSETQPVVSSVPGASRYNLHVLDSLVSIGLVRDLAIGDASSSAPREWVAQSERGPPKLVAVVGSGRAGALVVLRSSLVPDLVTEVPLPGVEGMWPVHFQPEGVPFEDSLVYHAYLLISVRGMTKVLQTGEELNEVKPAEVDFAMDSPTIFAGNLFNNSRIIQVLPKEVLLLSGSTRVQRLLLRDFGLAGNDTIVAACTADPYLLLKSSSGAVLLFIADEEDGHLAVAPGSDRLSAANTGRITACTLFHDTSRTFEPRRVGGSTGPRIYCAVCRSARLDIHALPDMHSVLSLDSVSDGQHVLGSNPAEGGVTRRLPAVAELRMECFRPSLFQRGTQTHADPGPPFLLMLLADGTLLAYRAFVPPEGGVQFVRMQLPLPARNPPSSQRPVFARFDGISDGKGPLHSGMFVSGERPLWLVSARNGLALHAMDVEGPVLGMTPFHNINCPHGFITACSGNQNQGSLKICHMPLYVRLEHPWPLQKMQLRVTPVRLAYQAETHLYALLASRQVPFREREEEEPGGDPHAAYSYAAAEAAAKAAGTEMGSEVRLLEPGKWQAVWRHSLDPGEEAVSVSAQRLHNTAAAAASESHITVGTCLNLGEDYPCTGRVLVFKVVASETVYDDRPLGSWHGTLVTSRELRGPVLEVAVMEGRILAAAGNRVEALELQGSVLQRVAFFDAQLLVSSLSTIKNFMLLGDVHKGLTFIHCTNSLRQLAELSKDWNNVNVEAGEFLVSGRKLLCVASDVGQSLHLFSYELQHPDTWRGKKLLPMGAIHTGHNASCMLAHKIIPASSRGAANAAKAAALRLTAAVFGTTGGALGTFAPMWEDLPAQQLLVLQEELALAMQHTAGLNPSTFRQRFRSIPRALGGAEYFEKPVSSGKILDVDLLEHFQLLPFSKQEALAAKCNSDRQRILAAIVDMTVTMSSI